MSDNLFQERLRELEEAKKHSVPDTEREKDLAAAAEPKDKITHKDVLVKRGVLKSEGVEIEEKTLTPAELKKREEVAKAMERDKPGMDKSKKMAIATAVAKRVAESMQIDELSKSTLGSYVKKAAVDMSIRHSSDTEDQRKQDDIYKSTYTKGGPSNADAEKTLRDKGLDRKSLAKRVAKTYSRNAGIEKAVSRLTKEDVGQIDELSKKTLGSYVKAASKDAEQAGRDQEYHGHENDYTRGEKRQKGIAKAVDRLTKEDVEQVSELSKTTLAAYYAKSIKDRHSKDLARDSAKRKGDEKETDALGRKVTNRSSGLEKAKAKFFKEDTDPTN